MTVALIYNFHWFRLWASQLQHLLTSNQMAIASTLHLLTSFDEIWFKNSQNNCLFLWVLFFFLSSQQHIWPYFFFMHSDFNIQIKDGKIVSAPRTRKHIECEASINFKKIKSAYFSLFCITFSLFFLLFNCHFFFNINISVLFQQQFIAVFVLLGLHLSIFILEMKLTCFTMVTVRCAFTFFSVEKPDSR